MRAAIAACLALAAMLLPKAAEAGLSCQFNAAQFPMTFSYDPVSRSAATATATISFTCTGIKRNGSPITISANGGTNGAPANREMKRLQSPNDLLGYAASLNASESPVYGDGTSGTQIYATTLYPASDGVAITFNVYGQIAAAIPGGAGDVHAGTYNDGVILTLTY